jgi:hypothetical protein
MHHKLLPLALILAALTACDSASKTADQASSQAASQVLDMNNKSKQAAQDIQKQLNQEADKINQTTQ